MRKFESGLFAGNREWIGARAHGRVLEVAIGTGRSLEFYGPDVTLTGVDLSPAMLDPARRHAADLGLSVIVTGVFFFVSAFFALIFSLTFLAVQIAQMVEDFRAPIRDRRERSTVSSAEGHESEAAANSHT